MTILKPGYLRWDGSKYLTDSNINISLGGDVSGTNTGVTVVGLQGRSVSSALPSDGFVLSWNAASNSWIPSTPGSGVALAGDVNGAAGANHVDTLTGTASLVTVANGTNLKTAGTSLAFKDSTNATRVNLDMVHGRITLGGGGTDFSAVLGPRVGFENTDANLWLLPNATAATSTNYTLDANGINVALNAVNASGVVYFTSATAISASISPTLFTLQTVPTIQFAAGIVTPVINQSVSTTGAGQTMTISAQSARAGFAEAGGELQLNSGVTDGSGFQGIIQIFPTSTWIAGAGANFAQFTAATWNIYSTSLSWVAATGSPSITQAQQANAAAPNNLTIAPQAPGAAATNATNGTPGTLITNLAAPVNGGSEAYITGQRGGSPQWKIGPDPGNPTLIAGIWPGVLTPTTSNYILKWSVGGAAALLQAVAASGQLNLGIAGTSWMLFDGSLSNITLGIATGNLNFVGSVQNTYRTSAVSFTIDTTTTDAFVRLTATQNVTLPAPTVGRKLEFLVDLTGGSDSTITFVRHAAENINGAAASLVVGPFVAGSMNRLLCRSNGVNWFITG